MTRHLLFVTLAAGAAIPAPAAEPAPNARGVPAVVRAGDPVATPMSDAERRHHRQLFAAIDGKRWSEAQALIDASRPGPLADFARADYYVAPGSPRVELQPILDLLARAPHLPQAAELARIAQARGATAVPPLPGAQRLVWLGSAPIRARATPQKVDAAGVALGEAITPLIVDNRPQAAEALVEPAVATLSPAALTELRQRVAWSYYIIGDDVSARRVAARAGSGLGQGEWAVQADWVAGLAAWRQRDFDGAVQAFEAVSARGEDAEMRAAGHYWAARADMAGGRPEVVERRLRLAAQSPETFYGLIAAQALGVSAAAVDRALEFGAADRARLERCANSAAAMALVAIGERGRADALVRHQARIGSGADHPALLRLARQLDLPELQLWLAHNGPRGARPAMAARYPAPGWTPDGGWRVDRSLVFAHTLQESRFRSDVVSPAGAHGLMQVRPGTAGDIARARGRSISPASLFVPATNIEYGQSYIEHLRDMGATGGLLPKVIAAYNAGPAPIAEWNARAFDRGDPLLYVESLPYWETRGYVPIVLRNYWMYQRQAGDSSPSLRAIAEGAWPRVPGAPGPASVRMGEDHTRLASAD